MKIRATPKAFPPIPRAGGQSMDRARGAYCALSGARRRGDQYCGDRGRRWEGIGWSTRSERDELLMRFSEKDWAHPVRALLAKPDQWLKWALDDRPPLYRRVAARRPCWATPRPCSRFLRKARPWRSRTRRPRHALVHVPGGTAAAMRHYEDQRAGELPGCRRPRAPIAERPFERVCGSSPRFCMRTIFGGELMLRRYDWIYDWRRPYFPHDHDLTNRPA